MHLVYLIDSNKFIIYDSYRFVGLPESKKYWHFTRRIPKNLPEILNEVGFSVTEPTEGTVFYQERMRWLHKDVCLTVYDQAGQCVVNGTGSTWVDALNVLASQLARPEASAK